MRYSLQHLLMSILVFAALVTLDVSTMGSLIPQHTLRLFLIVAAGNGLAYIIHIRLGRRDELISLQLQLASFAIVFAAVISFCAMTQLDELSVCTRTQERRTRKYLGVFRLLKIESTPASQIIKEQLQYSGLSGKHWQAEERIYNGQRVERLWPYPATRLSEEDLQSLRALSNEQIKDILELDTPLDLKFAEFRISRVIDLIRGQRTFPPLSRAEHQKRVAVWYANYEPFLHPFHSVEDVQAALRKYQKHPERIESVEEDFVDVMDALGIPIPK